MRIIVVGGSGLVGQELIRQLKGEATVLDIISSNEVCQQFIYCDITKPLNFNFKPDDIIIHIAANQYHNNVPRKNRQNFFDLVNVQGTYNVLSKMHKDGAKNMVFFSTDMVYGTPLYLPVDTNHSKNPFGFYGKSKIKSENLCLEYRKKGFNIPIFRPRMIIGPGRLGVLVKLFKLIDMNLPVPIIGNGQNCYQMVSVSDCANAILLAISNKLPNGEYNLGSSNPPKVKELLKSLIKKTKSRSCVIPMPSVIIKTSLNVLGKLGLEVMYREQYMIADKNYIVDISSTKKFLGWDPKYSDTDMLFEAYSCYERARKTRLF